MRTLAQIASSVGGTLIGGDPSAQVLALCPLEEPVASGLAFSRETSLERLERNLKGSQLAVLLVGEIEIPNDHPLPVPMIKVPDPFRALLELVPVFFPAPERTPAISNLASIHPSARIGKDCIISPFVSVGEGSKIGDGTTIHPNVVIYRDVTIGDRVIVHANAVIREGTIIGSDLTIQPGAVIGADGFGYVPDPKIGLAPIPHVGRVVLEDRVDIGANSCIDRGTLGTTKIGRGAKLDNLVQVGHNTHIGEHAILCGLVGVAGSARIGNQVVLGGHVGVADHVKIVDGARVGAKSGVSDDIKEKGDYIGFPLMPAQMWRRAWATLRKSVKRQ